MKELKQVVGIDVAQNELVCTLGRMFEDCSIDLYAYKVFKNNKAGFGAIISWIEKFAQEPLKVNFVMEATGVYHQKFAYHLDESGYQVSIVLPNKISNYIRTLEIRTITDKTCSQAITQFGLERKLELWKRPNGIYKNLQQLTRERDQITAERTGVKNQLHAESSEAEPNKRTMKRLKARIKFLTAQQIEIMQDLKDSVNQNPVIKKEIENICTIPGIAQLTATIILAETNGFELIRNKKQLAGYAGFDVVEKQSGTSVKGKARISKRGNRHLRKAMYLPAMAAVRYDENYKNLYDRLADKHGIKKKAAVAVQRKMLETAYILFKNKTAYDKDYNTRELSEQKDRAQIHAA